MPQISTAGRLLADLHEESQTLYDRVAESAGIVGDRADAARNGDMKLTVPEQLRLSEATISQAPTLSRQALRLRGQALAARSYEAGDTERHSAPPAERWGRPSSMR